MEDTSTFYLVNYAGKKCTNIHCHFTVNVMYTCNSLVIIFRWQIHLCNLDVILKGRSPDLIWNEQCESTKGSSVTEVSVVLFFFILRRN